MRNTETVKRKNKPGAGRPSYQPTPADINTVTVMAAIGIPHADIARCIGTKGIARSTLQLHFADLLETSRNKAIAAVASRLYNKALTSDNPAWAMFFLKTQGGWRERHQFEHTGKDGVPLLTLADIDRIVAGE